MSLAGAASYADTGIAAPVGPLPRARFKRRARYMLGALATMFLLSVVRVIADAPDLTSVGAFEAAIRLAVPIGLAALGGIYAERAGVVNIGLEGMMILGTWFGAWAGWMYGPWWGVVIGVLGGAVGGLLHAVATITFNVNHIVSGVAINILGAGVARFLSSIAFTSDTGGGVTQSPLVQGTIPHVSLPFLAGGTIFGWESPDLFGWLADQHWFFISDVAALARALTGNVSVLTIVAAALFPLSFYVLFRTRFGLRLRSVGENPGAAESLGVGVYKMKYYGVILSGALSGLAGAYLVLISSGLYKEGQTGGRGYIGLAAMIFGNWFPGGALLGAGLFGFADALQLRSDAAVHALLLVVAIGAGVATGVSIVRRQYVHALVTFVIGAVFLVWYLVSDTVPQEFVGFTPHVVTLVVLALFAQRLRMPAADGLPYRKGEVQ